MPPLSCDLLLALFGALARTTKELYRGKSRKNREFHKFFLDREKGMEF
jgi:hypothetical protein